MNPISLNPRIQLIDVACDVCGACDATRIIGVADVLSGVAPGNFQVVRCNVCGHRYLNPRPSDASLAALYPDDYAPFGQQGLSARVKRVQRRRLIRRYWSILGPPARVLDLGCGTGELLASIQALGNPNVVGVEPSERAAEIARQRFGLDVRTGSLETSALQDSMFDVVLMSHAIEHLPSPTTTLQEIQRVTTDQSHLLLWLPNADSWAASVLRRNWIGYDAPRHLHAFSPRTLSQLLNQHEFTVDVVKHEAVGLEWSWGLRLALRQHFGRGRIDRWCGRLHPLLTLIATPIAWQAARRSKAGRIFVLAHKAAKTHTIDNRDSDADLV